MLGALKYPNVWFASDEPASCSCIFRTLEACNLDLGFAPPEAWFEEEQESIDATKNIYQVISSLLQQGAKVESITYWVDKKEPFADMQVDLTAVTADQFRFFEGYRFEYKTST